MRADYPTAVLYGCFRALVTGRLVQRGDVLSVNVELVGAQENAQLWGEQYRRKMTDLLAVEGDISREIANRLRLRLTGEQQQRLRKRPTENPLAYEAYLKGRHYVAQYTKKGAKKRSIISDRPWRPTRLTRPLTSGWLNTASSWPIGMRLPRRSCRKRKRRLRRL
jgi:hypothetical protein